MPFMILKRIPTPAEVERDVGLESHTFLESFNEHSVSSFVTKLEYKTTSDDRDETVLHLGEWCVEGIGSCWFEIVSDL